MTRRPVFVPDAIPATLRDVPRWLVWQYQTRDGKPTKMPYDARSGRRAAVDRPASWSAFADALAAYRDADYAGLGIVLNGDGLIALDYDDCIADDGTIAPDVAADLAALGTYAERSPSGRGIRAFVVGDLPDGVTGKRRGDFEVYATARYVTVTGDRIGDAPETIADAGDALAGIYAARIGNHSRSASQTQEPDRRPSETALASLSTDDETIVRRLLTIPAAASLYRGDTTRYGDDESRADAALCCHLVYCGADAEQVARIVAASGLSRSKWSRDDYRDRTIAYAFRVTVDRYDQRETVAVLTVDGAAMRPEQPQDDGARPTGDLPDGDADELRRLRFEVDRLRMERDRAIAERDHANQTIRAVLTIIRNGELGAARVTGAATVIALLSRGADNAPDGMHPVTTKELGANAGVSASAASRHLRLLAALPESPLRRELRTVETVDRETGEIQQRQWTYIGMNAANVSEYADQLATSRSAVQHGGARERLACPDHPDAGAVKRSTFTLECADCARLLATGETVQRIKPDALVAAVDGDAGLQDAIGSPRNPAVIVLTTHAQDAIGSETARYRDGRRLHDATGIADGIEVDHGDQRDAGLHDATAPMPPLLPPSRSEIADRYTA